MVTSWLEGVHRLNPFWLTDEPVILSAANGLRAVVRVELAVRAARVLFDGVGREPQIGRDLVVGLALGDPREHLLLADGQLDRAPGQLRWGEAEPEPREAHGGDDLLDAPRLADEPARAQRLQQPLRDGLALGHHEQPARRGVALQRAHLLVA